MEFQQFLSLSLSFSNLCLSFSDVLPISLPSPSYLPPLPPRIYRCMILSSAMLYGTESGQCDRDGVFRSHDKIIIH